MREINLGLIESLIPVSDGGATGSQNTTCLTSLLNLYFCLIFSCRCSQTRAFTCCWRACGVAAPRCSWGSWRCAPPASMPSAPPAAAPAPAAVRPFRRPPWRSSPAPHTATQFCSSPAASPPSVSSFVWSAVRSAIAARTFLFLRFDVNEIFLVCQMKRNNNSLAFGKIG